MAESRSRPFGLVDAMILIASLATGLGLGLSLYRQEMAGVADPSFPIPFDLLPAPAVEFLADGEAPDGPPTVVNITGRMTPASPPDDAGTSRVFAQFRLYAARKAVACFLAATTLGSAGLALRKPRPRRRRLVMSPRFVPILVASIFAAFAVSMIQLDLSMNNLLELQHLVRRTSDAASIIGLGVLSIWAALAASGRLRVRGWLDWLGLGIGSCWAALWVASFLNQLW